MFQSTKERSGIATIVSSIDATIVKYAHIVCAVNLKKVSELLEEVWMFSVAVYMSTHMSTSYLDVCVRLIINRHGIINLHLLYIPVYEIHVAVVILSTV